MSSEQYLKGKNVWNVCEYDDNKLICARWDHANVYQIERASADKAKKGKVIEIVDEDQTNKNITDLVPLPAYDPVDFPFFIKRGVKRICLIDVLNKKTYSLYEDTNNKWGYKKVSLVDRGEGRFNLLYIVNEDRGK